MSEQVAFVNVDVWSESGARTRRKSECTSNKDKQRTSRQFESLRCSSLLKAPWPTAARAFRLVGLPEVSPEAPRGTTAAASFQLETAAWSRRFQSRSSGKWANSLNENF